MGLGKGRSSAPISTADERSAIDVVGKKKSSALATLRRMNDTLKPHTAVTTTEEEPGVSSSDVPAGTAMPVAHEANNEALNAGKAAPPSATPSFDSLGEIGAPSADGKTAPPVKAALSSDQKVAQAAADEQTPNDDSDVEFVESAEDSSEESEEQTREEHVAMRRALRHRVRIVSTETHFRSDEAQYERAQRVKQFLQLVHDKGIVEAQAEETQESDDEVKKGHRFLGFDEDGRRAFNFMRRRSNSVRSGDTNGDAKTPRLNVRPQASMPDMQHNDKPESLSDSNGNLMVPRSKSMSLSRSRSRSLVSFLLPEKKPAQLEAPPQPETPAEPQQKQLQLQVPQKTSVETTKQQTPPFVDAPGIPANRFVAHEKDNAQDISKATEENMAADSRVADPNAPSAVKSTENKIQQMPADTVSLKDLVQALPTSSGSAGSITTDGETYKRHLDPEEWQHVMRQTQRKIERRVAQGIVDEPDDMFSSNDDEDDVKIPKSTAEAKQADKKVAKPVGVKATSSKDSLNPPRIEVKHSKEDLSAPKVAPPKIEFPKVEAPKVEAPKVEVPRVEPPKVEPPKSEVAKPEVPKVETPKFNVKSGSTVDLKTGPKIDPSKLNLVKISEIKPDTRTSAPPKIEVNGTPKPPSNTNSGALVRYGDEDEEDEDFEQQDDDDADMNIPAGSVPGLGIGDEDPRLPHERLTRKQREKLRREQLMTDKERLEKAAKQERTQQARQRFKDQQEKVRLKQAMQAESAGWRQVGGWQSGQRMNTKEEQEDLLSKMTVLDTYVSDTYLGDWYQNAGLIVITALAAWFMGHVGLSVSWLSIVLLFTATAYRTSVRRMRRNTRDDMLRQVLLDTSAEKDTETMEWLNSFLIKFWLIFEPSLAQMITEIGNEVLSENTPTFIHSIKIDKFTLGTKSPRIDFVSSFPRTNAQIVVIDMGCSFTPNDTMDLTRRQLETKVNPKVQLGVRVGKGPFTKNLPILLENMMFKGKFRLRMRLMERPPHIETVDFSFLAPPEFDFVLKPIGGDTFGFDINIIPGLSRFIKETVHANLGPMFYAPNAFQINIEQLLAGVGVMTGVGVLTIQIIEASDLTRSTSDNRVDPYVVVRDKSQKELAHTKIKKNTTNPKWNETLNVIITNATDNVLLEVFDFDDSQPDRSIGQVPIEINQLVGSEISRSEITSGGRRSGYLKFIAKYSPVIMPTEEDEENGRGVRDMKSGILSIKIQGARNLNPTLGNTALLSPSADLEFNGRLIDSTKVSNNTNNPEWNFSAEHIVMDKVSTLLSVRLKDHRSKGHVSPQIGLFKMRINQLLIENEKGHTWFQLKDSNDEGEGSLGEVRVETQWKPANISVGGSTDNYVQPLGVVRMCIKNAKNLRNLEHIGKIDPYTRVFVGKRLVGRTDWFKNNLNPVWNECMYFPIQSELQDLTVEVMDVENHAKDRSLGAFKIKLASILKRDQHDNLKVFISEKCFESKLMLPNRGPKGTLEYTLEFYPAIPVVSPMERERIHTDEKVIEIFKKRIEEQKGNIEKALTPSERNDLVGRQERLDFSGIDMPVDELLTYQAGVFAVAVVSLHGHRLGQRLRIIANNSPFPIFTSPKFKSSKRYTSDDCPDFVSGQIQLSSLRFEIGTFGGKSSLRGIDEDDGDVEMEQDYNAHDRNAAEITISCHELIKEASYSPKAYELQNGAVIELQARFFPLPGLIIDPSEDISHCGNIEINLIRAVDVAPADPSGLSDPYCAFYLDNHHEKVYKSKIHKETLNPVWNEYFRFAVTDYRNSFVKAIVKDWDMGNSDDFLGGYKFELGELEPLQWKDYAVDLVKMKATREIKDQKPTSGTLYLRMRFLPGQLHKEGDHFVIGAASVTKIAGGLAELAGDGVIGVVGAAGFSLSSALGVVGAAAQGPTALKEKIQDIGRSVHKANNNTNKMDKLMKSYSVNIDSLTGIENVKNEVQIRCSLLTDKEREVYRSKPIKLEEGEATLDISFSFKSLPDVELGIKIYELKSLGRHSDVAQSSTDLTPGPKEVQMTKTAIASISVAED